MLNISSTIIRAYLFDSQFSNSRNYLIIISLLLMTLAGCGGGGERSTTSTSSTTTTDTSTSIIKLVGSVGDGPVIGANIKVFDAYGKIIINTTSDSNANYSIDVSSKIAFPVTITATGGTDIVSGLAPDFTMQTVAFKKSELTAKHIVNINPFSTFVVKMAQSMPGGLSTANVATAKQTLFDTFSFGLDQTLISDPITSGVTNNNIAGVIKASEAMGEMIRRTRDSLISSGSDIDGDYVLTQLSNDLADGKLDASGNNSVDVVTATAKIVSAQVLIENMQNQLKVNGVVATNLLNNAILTSRPDSTLRMADVALTANGLTQTMNALKAAERLTPSAEISTLLSTVSGLSTSATTADIDTAFTGQSLDSLTSAINLVPLVTAEQIATINDDSIITNTVTPAAPVITSSAILTAKVGEAYSYDVNATDANSGDTLSYTLNKAPSGMSINSVTGLIQWTPLSTHTGQHSVSVKVTDNSTSALIVSSNFVITVSAKTGAIIRVNAGGGEYTDSKGQVWSADAGYNLGAGHIVTDQINGTVDDPLYQSERWHSTWKDSTSPELEYSFSVPNGKYVTILHFAEISNVARVFDVIVENNLVIDNFNIADKIGRYTATTGSFSTNVTDGELSIQFSRDIQSPKISAIEILPITNQTNASTTNNNTLGIQIPEASSSAGNLSIIGSPTNGSVVVSGYNISYTPNAGFDGQDIVTYMLIDDYGVVTISTITITVTCTSCTKEAFIALGWQPNSEPVTGYRIYYGPDATNATELASDLTVISGLIDPTAPSIKYAATSDLNFYPGESICFKIQAYKDSQSSALSDPICGTI